MEIYIISADHYWLFAFSMYLTKVKTTKTHIDNLELILCLKVS